MRTTNKYSKILLENNNTNNEVTDNYQLPVVVQVIRDFDVIATEVRAIITKTYEADEQDKIKS